MIKEKLGKLLQRSQIVLPDSILLWIVVQEQFILRETVSIVGLYKEAPIKVKHGLQWITSWKMALVIIGTLEVSHF